MWSIRITIVTRIFIRSCNRAHMESRKRYLIETAKNTMKILKIMYWYKIMKYLTIHDYVIFFWNIWFMSSKQHFIGDDTQKEANVLQLFWFIGLGLCIIIKPNVSHVFMYGPWVKSKQQFFYNNKNILSSWFFVK